MSSKDLQNKTLTELRETAKTLKIPKWWKMRKQELCDAIPNFNSSLAENKLGYIKTAPLGTLVAFRVGEKLLSGKITDRFEQAGGIDVQTKSGDTYTLKYEDIVWVKTGKRWPQGVHKELTNG